uniref:Uncharacterized protein n=1 Tax=viral metagenome TaxID=1070528 RepID=A0A6C0ET06_9ZZZZ
MAHLFEIDDDMSPLQCHSEDCVMNVFNYLGILTKKDALNIANTTDSLNSLRIEDFLTDTYGVNFHSVLVYDNEFQMDTILYELEESESNLLKYVNEGFAVIAFLYSKAGHAALLHNINGEIYYVDPQNNLDIPFVSPDMGYIMAKYQKIKIMVSEGPATRFTPDVDKLKKKLSFNRHVTRLKKTKNTYLSRELKRTHRGTVLQHKNLIRGQTYQIVNKKTEKTLGTSIFQEFKNNYAVAVFEDFSVYLPSYYFINVNARHNSRSRHSNRHINRRSTSKRKRRTI